MHTPRIWAFTLGLLGLFILAGPVVILLGGNWLLGYVTVATVVFALIGFTVYRSGKIISTNTGQPNAQVALAWENYNLRRFIRSMVIVLSELRVTGEIDKVTIRDIVEAYTHALPTLLEDMQVNDAARFKKFAVLVCQEIASKRVRSPPRPQGAFYAPSRLNPKG